MTQLEIAWDAAERGIRQSADHAESCEPGFGEAAYTALTLYAGFGYDFTSEMFRKYAASIGLAMPVPKALGACFLRAARAGVIEKVGYQPSTERHGSPCPVWRLRQAARAAA